MSGRTPTEPVAAAVPPLSGTKLHAPRLRRDTIRRPRLTDTLVTARPALVLIVAPPGFGKTALLSDWADRDDRRFAWVSVNAQDNDPAVLWSYIGAAIAGRDPGKAPPDDVVAPAREGDPVEAALRAASDAADEFVLVLDDYHLIRNQDCQATVFRFLAEAPPNVEVVMSTRADPPLRVARERAGGRLLEVGASDLRFTPDEGDAYLNSSLGLGLEPADVQVLHDRTEGWPAGLYLAHISMRKSSDRKRFVATFGASNRHVGDYLNEQVLPALEPRELEFMLATCVVDELCGALADALTGTRDSAARLAELERANVFLTALDERREWYRYHNLLAELLRLELRRDSPDVESGQHLRASIWFEDAGDADRAIRHAIDGGYFERASRLIGGSYLQALELGRLATISSWLDAIGAERVEADPRLGIVRAWVMHFLGFHDEATAGLATAQRSSFEGVLPDGSSSIEASAALMGAAFPGGDVGRMLANARRAFELESHAGSPWRTTVHVLLGFALVRNGDFAEADRHLELGGDLAARSGMWMDAVGAGSLRARVALERGDPAAAERLAREAVAWSDAHGVTPTASGAFARAVLGEVLVQGGNPLEGETCLDDAIPALRALREPVPLAEALLAKAHARWAHGDRRAAVLALEEADLLIAEMTDPGYLATTRRAVARELHGQPPSEGEPLSSREVEVLRQLADGLSKREVATRLYVSYNTVHSHVRAIYRKLGVASRDAAIDRARDAGILT
jgi:LuxR family transcriptional regulator, maltose regulon positive regulatory protein